MIKRIAQLFRRGGEEGDACPVYLPTEEQLRLQQRQERLREELRARAVRAQVEIIGSRVRKAADGP